MSDIPTWGLFVLGGVTTLGGGAIVVYIGRFSSKLFKDKAIDTVVNSANSVIEMYEHHITALTASFNLKIAELEGKIDEMGKQLADALLKNDALQKLLLVSPAVKVENE